MVLFIIIIFIWLQKYARSDWLLSGQDFLVMTGLYENFYFSVNFALDLGVIKQKFLIFNETVSTVPSGFDRTARVVSVQ